MDALQRDSQGDRLYNWLSLLFIGLFLAAVLYPIIFVISASFSSPDAVVSGWVRLWPVDPGFQGYQAVLAYKPVWVGYGNSVLYTVAGTIINVVLTVLAAYPLSRKDCFGRNGIMLFIAFTMIFHGGLIPTYLVVHSLHMVNTFWAMVLPNAIVVFNLIIARTYFQSTISSEILEAAQMDGCSDFKFLGYIVLPLSKAILAVITLFYAVEHWNAYFDALIYLRDGSKFPLQIILRQILELNSVDTSMLGSVDLEEIQRRQALAQLLKYSLIVLSSLPVLILYPFVQKYFVRGVMIGSLKG